MTQDFIQNVKTLFNNDQDNTSGLGVGTDREYFETHEGKLINAKGVKAPLPPFLFQRQHRKRPERIHRTRSLRPPS